MNARDKRGLVEELIKTSGSARIRCIGSSMEPTVPRGSNVVIERCARPRPGDVVLFKTADALMLHRVVWYLDTLGRFVHVGDRHGGLPGIATTDRIIGRAVLERRTPGLAGHFAGMKLVAQSALARLGRAPRG